MEVEIINPAKRQYLDIHKFGESFKWGGLITGAQGRSIHAMAIAWLTCRTESGSGLLAGDDLGGSWSGDSVYLASDAAAPDQDGNKTSTPAKPDRNLCAMAHGEFEDITPRVIRALCEKDRDLALILSERTDIANRRSPCSLMRLLVRLAREEGGPILEALEARYGEDWEEVYEKAEQDWTGS